MKRFSRACDFLIDLKEHQVYCRRCKGVCDRLMLPEFDLFWCPDVRCENTSEARYYGREDKWKFCPPSLVWQEALLQRALASLTPEFLELEGKAPVQDEES